MYHISDIKKFLRCERLYYYDRGNNSFKAYLRNDENIVELICKYLNIDNYFLGIRNDQDERFMNSRYDYEWFFHPRLTDNEFRINIPIIHRKGDIYDLYYINYGIEIKDLDLITFRIYLRIMKKHNLKVDNIYIIYLNGEYVNQGQLDPSQLFKITEYFKNDRIIDLVNKSEFDYETIIDKMENYVLSDNAEKRKSCRMNGLCSYYDNCFKQEKRYQNDSIITLVTSKYKYDMHDEGLLLLKDVDTNRLEGNRSQYAQIMASRNGGVFVDKVGLRYWLDKINKRPISFIDFEWDRYMIPPYQNMKPLDVLCFEFALYYIDENNQMHHYTFVSKGDCRKEFVEALIEKLPKDGPILAYNAKGAESLRIKELAQTFKEYEEILLSINDRFVDLADPFTEGLVYDIRMRGNYSLKRLVDICSDYTYDNLDIDDGMDAVLSWRTMDKSDEDDTQIIDNLKEYCSLDAFGLFLVYKWLIKLLIES